MDLEAEVADIKQNWLSTSKSKSVLHAVMERIGERIDLILPTRADSLSAKSSEYGFHLLSSVRCSCGRLRVSLSVSNEVSKPENISQRVSGMDMLSASESCWTMMACLDFVSNCCGTSSTSTLLYCIWFGHNRLWFSFYPKYSVSFKTRM